MLRTLIKFLIIICTSLNLVACSNDNYRRIDFLNDLSLKAGFKTNEDMYAYLALDEALLSDLDLSLSYAYAYEVLELFIDESLSEASIINEVKEGILNKEEAIKLIDDLVYTINNRNFETKKEFKERPQIDISDDIIEQDVLISDKNYKIGDIFIYEDEYYVIKENDNHRYHFESANIEDIYNELELSYSGELDFSDVEVIEEQALIKETSIYEDDIYQRYSDDHYANVKEINGYRVSYSFRRGSLYFYVSKEMDDGTNVFFNTKITNFKPTFKWDYKDGVINEAYFKMDYKTHENFGFSRGKYKRFFADFDALKNESLIKALSEFVKTRNPMSKSSFTICRFALPIPELPSVDIVVDVKLNFYISGKVGISIETVNHQGLEIINNKMRVINDNLKDVDVFVQANGSSTLSLSMALAFMQQKLLDMGVVTGVKAKLKTMVHLLDDFKEIDVEYDVAEEILEDKGIPVCADVSFYWVLDIIFNSYDTVASKLGFNKEVHLLDEDNQIFGNMRHIENGMFVEKCTRKGFKYEPPELELHADEIVLNTYAIVLKDATEQIEVLALPQGYTRDDLKFSLNRDDIVSINNELMIKSLRKGACKLRIYTKDEKYEVYVNILVSDNQSRTLTM